MKPVEILNPPDSFSSNYTKQADKFIAMGIAEMTPDGKLRFLDRHAIEPISHSFTAEEIKNAKQIPKVTPTSKGVYLLKSSTGLFKIGCTKNLLSRMSDFWNIIPEDLEIFAFAPTKEHRASERYLHSQYQSVRVKGEWFALTEKDICELIENYDFILVNKTINQFIGECLIRK
jgi:hypothetical protein